MMENKIKYDMGGSTSPRELKGYRVRIFTNNLFGSAKNIVSNGNDSAILVTDGKTGDSSTVMSNEPYLLLKKMEFRGRTSISAEPVNYGHENKWKMFGGAFVYSSDSRFSNDISQYPVPLHDRVEYKDGGGIDYSEFDKPSYMDAEDWEKISKRIEAKESAKHKHLGTHKQFTDWWYSGGEEIAMKKYGPDRITAWSEAYEDFKNDASYKNGGNISEENQSKIAKLEKVVASTMIPDAVKEQAKAEIERLRSETSMGGEENNIKKNNPELNKEVYRIVNKINDKDSFEQIVSEVLTDANYHPEAFKFATILDKTIKTKDDWYKSDRFVADDENRKVALKISKLSHWDADYFGPALEFALKMKGFHRIAEALEQALSTDATNDYPNAIDEITKRQTEYAQDIANRTGLRQSAVAEFIAKNGLNEKETLNILQGLGMKKLDPRDFMTAVMGVPNNEYETKIVSFAKSNEAFKTPEPSAKPTPKAISKGNLSSFARYISKRNIKYVVVEIDGKELTFNNSDILDGLYILKDKITKAKPSKKTPKVTRTQFEEEEFEFGNGGGVSSNTFYVKNNFGHWSVIDSRNNKMVVGYSQKEDANITANGLNNIDNSNELEETISQLQTQKGYAHFLNKYAQGGKLRKAPFKVGDMVYSYQNPNHKMRISFVEDRGVIDGVDYGWGIKVALKTDSEGNYDPKGTYSKSSKWMSHNSVSKVKKEKYEKGGKMTGWKHKK